jgi:hypothetical protein
VSIDNRRRAPRTVPPTPEQLARLRELVVRDAYRVDLDVLAERIVDDELRRR